MASQLFNTGKRKVRTDQMTGFVCVTDIGNANDPGFGAVHVTNWMSDPNTIGFIEAWEIKHNPSFEVGRFEEVRTGAGNNTFRISVAELEEVGVSGITEKQGHRGGIFCAVDWAVHFSGWLDPRFYVEILDTFRRLTDRLHGRDALHKRFSHDLAVENTTLVVDPNQHKAQDARATTD